MKDAMHPIASFVRLEIGELPVLWLIIVKYYGCSDHYFVL